MKKKTFFSCSESLRCWIHSLINVKMPTIFGILTFMSRINFMLSWVEHEKSFITMRSGIPQSFSKWKSKGTFKECLKDQHLKTFSWPNHISCFLLIFCTLISSTDALYLLQGSYQKAMKHATPCNMFVFRWAGLFGIIATSQQQRYNHL